ncbi:MAG: cytochrome b [Geminicoccaceae bacterium]|nr:cytochrome b [Geminicoccaceae bacterium]MDW8370569.1 cytochrome b [Geminicoccaceae bacterium]
MATARVGATVERYPAALIVLHWAMAILILATIPIGWRMGDLEPGPLQDTLYHTHRSIGVTVLALAVLRLVLRRTLGAPPPHPSLPAWQRTLSVAVHHLLYVLFFLVPILGWAGTSAFGAPIVVWGLFELPPILPRNEPLSELLLGAHGLFSQTLAGLVILHVAGALYHAFVRRDGVMQRMLFGRTG